MPNTPSVHVYGKKVEESKRDDENMEMRLRGGLPRGNAVRHVQQKHGVNCLATICAIDRATLPTVCDYWAPGVKVAGVTELLANALVLRDEKPRTCDLRGEPLPAREEIGPSNGNASDE